MFRQLGDYPVQTLTDDETEAQREAVTYVKSQSKSMVEIRPESSLSSRPASS